MKRFKKSTAALLSLALVLTLLIQGSVSAASNTASASDDDAVNVQESVSAETQEETTDDTASDKDAETAEATDDTAADADGETSDDAAADAADDTASGANENAADDAASGEAAGTTAEDAYAADDADGGETLSAGTVVADAAAAGSISADELTEEAASAAESGETIEESVIVEEASGDTATSGSIDLSTFMTRLQNNSWTYDGSTADEASDGVLTVQWSPDSSNSGSQVNSNNLQYYLANASASAGNTVDVTISNVSFVYVAADFTLNNTSYSASTYKTAQMYFMNCGNLTVNNCSFKNVVLTHWLSCSDSTHSSTVTNCTFDNTDTGQAGIKDLRGSYITVTGCTFIGCETGIRVSQSGTSVTVYSVNLSNNTFTTLQSGGNLFDLADPSGNYANASIVINNNVADDYTITNCTTFSIKSALTSGGNFTIGLMTGDITDIVNESGTIKYQTTWGEDLGQSTVNKITFASDADSAAEYYRYIFTNTSYTLPDADVVTAKDGYSFAGWTTDGNTVYAAGDTVTVTAAAAYYALWTCDHASYTGEVTKEATCTEDGLMTYTCSSCGDDSYTEVIAATGHTWNTTPDSETWEQTDSGYTVTLVFSCSVCGATKTVTQSVEFSSSSSGTDSDSDSDSEVTYTITSEAKTAANGDTYTIYTALITIGSVSYTSQTTAAYSVTDGTEQTISSDDTLTVTGSGTAAQFTSLTIDGVTVDAAYYTLDEATGEITVSSEYLATLDAGDHTLTLVYADGTASTSFTVEDTAETEDEDSDDSDDSDSDDSSDDDSDSDDSSNESTDTLTKTGDSTGIGLWVVLLIAAAAAAAIVLAVYFARMPRRSKRKTHRRRR